MGLFCDESGTHLSDKEECFGIAALAIPDHGYFPILMRLQEIRRKYRNWREIKWSTIPKWEDCAHVEYVRFLAHIVALGEAHLHIMFVPKNLDHARSGPGGIFATVSKMYWQMIFFRAIRFYGETLDIHTRPDGGECTRRLNEYVRGLTERGGRQFKAKPGCLKPIKPRDSKQDLILQMVDVTLGAFTCLRNGRSVNPANARVANIVYGLYGGPNLFGDVGREDPQFSIWNWRSSDEEKNTPPGLSW